MFPSSCQVLFLVISPGFFVRFAIAFVVWYDSPYQTWANSPKILYFIVKGGTAMEKLYEQDAYLRAFDAKVLSCVQGKGDVYKRQDFIHCFRRSMHCILPIMAFFTS